MALTAKVLSVQLPQGSDATYVDATSSGFGTPDAVLVFGTQARDGANPSANGRVSIGFWDGTDANCIGYYSADNVATSLTSRYLRAGSILVFCSWSGSAHTTTARYTIAAAPGGDGVRITLAEDNTTVTRAATVVLLKGVSNKKVGIEVHDGAGGAVNVTTPGFQPDLVFYLTNGLSSGTDDAPAGYGTFGAAHYDGSTITQHCVSWAAKTGVTTTVVNNSVNDDCVGRVYYDDGAVSRKDTISDFDASGFSITPATGTPTSRFIYLAIELPDPDDAYVAIVDSRTSTGTGSPYTGTGFTPVLLGLFGNLDTATNSTSTTPAGAVSFGWASDTSSEQSIILADDDANSTATDSNSQYDSGNVLNLRTEVNAAETVAELNSFDSDGWTLNYSDASASARKMLAIAIGNSVTAVTLTVGTATQANAATTGVITQVQKPVAAASTQANAAGTGVITQAQVLVGALATEAHQAGTGTVSLASTLTAAASSQANAATTGTVSQTQVLVAAAATQANQSGTGSLTGAVTLVSAASIQANSTLAAAISQSQILVSSASVQANQSGTGSLTGATSLTGAESVQANEGGTGAAVVVHDLAASVSTSAAQSGTGAITQFHQLVAAGSIQVNQSGTGRLAGVAGWICATPAVYPAVSGDFAITPAVTADTEVYPRGCH